MPRTAPFRRIDIGLAVLRDRGAELTYAHVVGISKRRTISSTVEKPMLFHKLNHDRDVTVPTAGPAIPDHWQLGMSAATESPPGDAQRDY